MIVRRAVLERMVAAYPEPRCSRGPMLGAGRPAGVEREDLLGACRAIGANANLIAAMLLAV